MTDPGGHNCHSCGTILAPTMTVCPHCGEHRIAEAATDGPPPVQVPSVPAPPKEAKGLHQDIFGPNAIWVAVAFFVAAPFMKYFGFVGDVVVIFLDLFGLVINLGWTIRVASEKGHPVLCILGIFPILGPIIVSCIPARPGYEMKPLILANQAVDIPLGVPYNPPPKPEAEKADAE